ncbi:uncharacterized protein LOC128220539 [Mya arenaria]|uniref:uncharacterized protein LOC128220532 n=1 Tax=Mya arenaria TaxID=6604 RepID=UPI0022E7AA85|nr:uncharacterized protein LOC128220532 [Mya arenaria]XP_052784931.1 uncharacterized protein LOC128220539 [Mya arenaria]
MYVPFVVKCLFLYILNATWITLTLGSGAFTQPNIPACYVSASLYETVDGMSKICNQGWSTSDRAACSDDGDAYYLYCSTDHDCCSIDGCPACCTSRTTLSKYEVAGIVISCVAVTFAALLVTYLLAGRYCKYGTA